MKNELIHSRDTTYKARTRSTRLKSYLIRYFHIEEFIQSISPSTLIH